MIDLKNINKNCIIICPSSKKEELVPLFNSNIDYSVKFLSKGDLISSLTFTYDNDAILYLINKGYKYDNAIEILNNLNFVKKGTNKLDLLVSLKDELTNNGLLKFNPLFRYIFINKSVYIYGYSSLDKELIHLLDNINVKYQFILEEKKNFNHQIITFESIEDEVSYFFNQICKMKESGVELTDIGLYSYPSEYDLILRKYSKNYSLPINFTSNMSLDESPIFKEYLLLIDELSLEEAFEHIKEKDDRFNSVTKILNLVNNVLNLDVPKEDKINLIKNQAKSVKLKEAKYQNGIEIVSSSYRGDKHIFILGFSLGSYPPIKKDTDFLLDSEKEICNINTSKTDNDIAYEELENFLLNNKNIHISLKQKVGDKVYYDSLLIEKMGYKKVSPETDEVRYSKELLELEVASYQDLKSDYGIDNQYVDGINVKDFRYKEYDHHFKQTSLIKKDDKLEISFTQIDNYFKCPFKYYIQKILGVNDFETTFEMNLGVLFHLVLEDSLKKDVHREDYQDFIDEHFKTYKELFFIDKLFDQVFEVINKNRSFNLITSFNQEYGEQELRHYFDSKTSLFGKVDKIMVNDEEKEIVVVDYKTGSYKFQKNHVELGLSLQLPLYSYLIMKNYPEYTPTGIYIQNVLDNKEDIDKRYRLTGLSIYDDDKLARLEHGLEGYSKYVSGLRKITNGYQEKGTTSKEDYEELIKISEQKVLEAISKIRNGEYPIHPLSINEQDQVCKYCPLKGICFVKDEDINRQYIEKDEEEED